MVIKTVTVSMGIFGSESFLVQLPDDYTQVDLDLAIYEEIKKHVTVEVK